MDSPRSSHPIPRLGGEAVSLADGGAVPTLRGATPTASRTCQLRALWRTVRSSDHRLLMLDYDGTIAAFRVHRMSARPTPFMLFVLRELSERPHTTLAVVSGRRIVELRHLLGGLPAHYVGEYGWETLTRDDVYRQHAIGPAVAVKLERADRAMRAAGWEQAIERKRCSVVLHSRGLSARESQTMMAQAQASWSRLESDELSLERFDGGIELRASRRNKGTAVADLLQDLPDGSLPIYIGDDVGDEMAFARVRDRGVTIRVGRDARKSFATWRLRDPDDVAALLHHWTRYSARAATSKGGTAT